MNTSLFSRILTASESDAALLDKWLAECDAARAIADCFVHEPDATVDTDRLAGAIDPPDGTVRPGQIRILPPRYAAFSGDIPCVAVLERWMDCSWLVAPFSPWSTPATDGEMSTGIALLGRCVLQTWNTRTVDDSVLSRSRYAGDLNETVLRDARALFRHAVTGAPLPENFTALVGPSILSKADPRREYVAESAARFDLLTEDSILARERRAVQEAVAKARQNSPGLFAETAAFSSRLSAQSMRLSAGERPEQTTETFSVPELEADFDLKLSPDEGRGGTVRVVVFDTNGNPGKTLDGLFIVTDFGDSYGPIQGGVLSIPVNAISGLSWLFDPEKLITLHVNPNKPD